MRFTLLIPLFSALLGLSIAPRLAAQETSGNTAPLSLDPAIMTMGTSVLGQDGRNWAYVVWKSPKAATLAGRSFGIYLQSTPGGPFAKQSVVTPTADPAALNLLLDRSNNLGADNAELNEDLGILLSRPSWANGTSFDAKSVLIKLSACMNRALSNGDASLALNIVAPEHPALRMAMGQAWAGALPAGNLPMTIEVREHVNGVDGAVIGHVTITPGQGIALQAPGKVVQVPDLQPSGHRNVKLRWATPDDLRRQQLQVLGFRVYRVHAFQASSRGLSGSSTGAEVAAQLAGPSPMPVTPINEAPVPIAKLFTDANVGQFSGVPLPPFFLPGGDPTTFFVLDNFRDLAPELFSYNFQSFYFVRAIDLLGREGPPSGLCEGRAVETIPPDVPSGLEVKDLPIGPGNERRMQLRWRANTTATDGRTTHRYAVYKHYANTGSLTLLEVPQQFRTLDPIGYVESYQADSLGYLTFVDDNLTTMDVSMDHTVWYGVTAIHETPLDYLVSNIHDRVQSAPSPPAFGIFRDRQGPPPPSGGLGVNIQKFISLPDAPFPKLTAPRPQPHLNNVDILHVRGVAHRRDSSVEGVRFSMYLLRTPTQLQITDWLAFPPGKDEVSFELPVLRSVVDAGYSVFCAARTADGCASLNYEIEYEAIDVPAASESVYYDAHFKVGKFAATEFVPNSGSLVADRGIPVPVHQVVVKGPGSLYVILAETHNGQTVVTQTRDSPSHPWVTLGTGKVGAPGPTNVFYLPHADRSLTETSNPWEYRVFRLPPGGDCKLMHEPRPPDAPDLVPVPVWITVPETTKEWRVYRRVDSGPLALVKSGIQDLSAVAENVIVDDHAMPPNGGVLNYYAQCFDQNNNPSPLVFLDKVSLVPEPAKPVLSAPEPLAAVEPSGLKHLRLRWFCPPAGVKGFRVMVLPLNYYDTEAEAVAPLVKIGAGDEPSGNLYSVSYTLTGETKPRTVKMGYFFHTPDISPYDTNAMHTCEVLVDPNVAYVTWVQVIGMSDSKYPTSQALPLQWKTPGEQIDAGTNEPIVPWPTRALPPVKDLGFAGADVFLMKDVTNALGFEAEESSVFDEPTHTMMNLYPVGIRIGLLPFSPKPRGELNTILPDVMAATYPAKFVPPSGLALDPAAYTPEGLFPCVLYRQTILPSGAPGALVQVSPLREAIAWKQELVDNTPPGGATQINSPGCVLRDPFIKLLSYTVSSIPVAWLTLVDTHSVEEGATYHYYIASYASGELSAVWDCGTITIPETP